MNSGQDEEENDRRDYRRARSQTETHDRRIRGWKESKNGNKTKSSTVENMRDEMGGGLEVDGTFCAAVRVGVDGNMLVGVEADESTPGGGGLEVDGKILGR